METVAELGRRRILLDAAYDTSLRDLRNNWLPVSALVSMAVGVTTAVVAVLAHTMRPDIPWSAAIALAIVTAVFAFIGWLNEKWAVQFLRKARARLLQEQMF